MDIRHPSIRRPWLRWPTAVGAVALATGSAVAQPAAPVPAARLLPPTPVTLPDNPPVVRGLTPDFRPPENSLPAPVLTNMPVDERPAGSWLTGPPAGGGPKSLYQTPAANATAAAVAPPANKPSMLSSAWADVKELVAGKPADPAKPPAVAYQFVTPKQPAAARPGASGTYAGPPAYRWYGWGTTTPGANPLSPAGQYPQGSANWYAQTGATPGAFPIPVSGPRLVYGGEPPIYAGGPAPMPYPPTPVAYQPPRPQMMPAPAPLTMPVTETPRPTLPAALSPTAPGVSTTIPVPPPTLMSPAAVVNDPPQPITAPVQTAPPQPSENPSVVPPPGQPMPLPVTPVVGVSPIPAADRTVPVAWQRPAGAASEPLAFVRVTEKPVAEPTTVRGQAPEWSPGNAPAAKRPMVVQAVAAVKPAEPDASFAPPLETAVKTACHGWATVTAIKPTGAHRLRIELTAPTPADARVAFDQVSQLPVLKPYEVQFEVKLGGK